MAWPRSAVSTLTRWYGNHLHEAERNALYVRNGVVHIIDCNFFDNEAALIGPDVGGGAIYVIGVPEVVITGSRFEGNRAAHGGAVGMLFANPRIYNSVFENNTAEGVGMNYVEPGCPPFNHDEQGGAGGNSGAVYFDGRPMELAPRELALLQALLGKPGHAIAKERLFELVFPGESQVQPEAIEVVAYRLRKKIAHTGAQLVTLRGLGYLLKATA